MAYSNPSSKKNKTADPLQNLLEVMNFQVDQANAEKSELAVEKAKRLEAEKEAEELRKKLVEMKLVGADRNKGIDLEKRLQLLMQKPKEAGTQNGECNRGKPEKQYSDPAWFPGSSGSNDLDSQFCKNNLVNENSSSAPPSYVSLFQSPSPNCSGRGGPFPRNYGPSPPNHMPPPQFNNMNFQRPQFPSNDNYYNAPPPFHFSPQFHDQMPMKQGVRNQKRPPFNPNKNCNMPNFTQGPDQVRFTRPPQQNQLKNKTKQPTPTKQKGDNQKNQPKQPNQQNPSKQPSQANQSTEKKKHNNIKKTSQPNNQGTETNQTRAPPKQPCPKPQNRSSNLKSNGPKTATPQQSKTTTVKKTIIITTTELQTKTSK